MSDNLVNFHNLTKSQKNTIVAFVVSAATMLAMGFLVVFIILAGKPGTRAAGVCSYSFLPTIVAPATPVSTYVSAPDQTSVAKDTFEVEIFSPNSIQNASGTRVGPGTLTLTAPSLEGTYGVSVKDITLNAMCVSSSNNTNLIVSLNLLVCKADVNHDGVVTAQDAQLVFSVFQNKKPYDANYDLNGDGKVSAADAQRVFSLVGQKCSYSLSVGSLSTTSVVFTTSPQSAGGIFLVIKNPAGSVVAKLGPIPAGQTTIPWNLATTAALPQGTYSATLVFSNDAQASNTVTFPVQSPPPTVKISAASTTIPFNTSTTIFWTSTNASSCEVFPPGWKGTTGQQPTGNLTQTTNYIASCTGPGGSAKASVTVNVVSSPSPSPTAYPSPKPSPTPATTPTPTSWTLIGANVLPTTAGINVVFNFTPGSNGNINLVVISSNTGDRGFDSGPIPSGSQSVIWQNAPVGNYTAALYYGTSKISNSIQFVIQ